MGRFDEQLKHFEKLLEQQAARVERLKNEGDFVDYKGLDKLIIGVVGGDGIGPMITSQAQRVLEFLLADEIAAGKIELRTIVLYDNGTLVTADYFEGKTIDVKGFVGCFDGEYQIEIYSVADVTIHD